MIIDTVYGKLRGRQLDGYAAFLGIPYAKPPVGERRWRAPERPEPWDGVRDALTFSAIAMQDKNQAIPGNDPTEGHYDLKQSEDCLYLNVWTPSTEGRHPVFLWFHGGACCCGSGNGRNASPLPFVRRGIVFVTMNYRLGILGFLAHPELSRESEHGVSGNYAHLDQIAALDWVRENIASFGGDPDHIVIGGCSAGAIAAQALSCSPLTEGKIVGAVIESGIGMDPTSYPESFKVDTLAEIEEGGMQFQKALGAADIAEMRAMSYEQLAAVPDSFFRRRLHFGTTLGTCGDGYVLPIPSNECTMTLRNHNMPYLVGTTHDEGGGFAAFISPEEFLKQSTDLFGEEVLKVFEEFPHSTKEEVRKLAHDMHTGHCAAKAFAEIQSDYERSPVYVFDFAHRSPETGTAHHGLETRYLLGSYHEIPGADENDERIAEQMQDYWCSFIRDLKPSAEGMPAWKPYTAAERNVLVIGDEITCQEEKENALQTFVRAHAVQVCRKRIEEEKQ